VRGLPSRWRHAGIPVTDAHVHVNRFDLMRPEARALIEANPTFPLMQRFVQSPHAFVDHLDRQGIWQAWLINYCAPHVVGYGSEVNDWAAAYAAVAPDRLVAVGGYEPRTDGDGATAVERLHGLGIRGLKVHPVHQHLAADDPRLEAAFGACARLGMPAIVHTGTSRFPGADNGFADPAPLDAVLRRHPDLQVVLAHGGRPHHTRQALELVQRHDNAWLELSSCPPARLRDYFGDLEQVADRTLWGSDWPGPGVPGMAENVEAFLALGLDTRACHLILHDNAEALLPAAPTGPAATPAAAG
jgi:uncharacterized protein